MFNADTDIARDLPDGDALAQNQNQNQNETVGTRYFGRRETVRERLYYYINIIIDDVAERWRYDGSVCDGARQLKRARRPRNVHCGRARRRSDTGGAWPLGLSARAAAPSARPRPPTEGRDEPVVPGRCSHWTAPPRTGRRNRGSSANVRAPGYSYKPTEFPSPRERAI